MLKRDLIMVQIEELLDYIQKHDNTFSLERVAMLDGIRADLS